MARGAGGGDRDRMAQLTNPAPLRVSDAIALPADHALLTGRAARAETYPIQVVGTLAEVIERLLAVLDGAPVAVVTDMTVEALYGRELIRGLREAGHDPLVRSLPSGEATKSLEHAVAAWQWLAE